VQFLSVKRVRQRGGSNVRALDTRRRRWMALPLALGVTTALLALPATSASAATLTSVSWSISNNQVSATAVSYSYSFTAATTGTIKTITFAVSGAGLAGTPAIAKNFGVGAGSVARSGQTITYTVTSAASVSANTPIYIELSGLTNSSTAGSYTTVVTTQTAAPATIDSATSPSVTLATNNTAVTVTVAKSLTFTINNTAFELDLDPSLPSLADETSSVGLSVQTNAHSGYTLSVADTAAGLQSASTGNPTIARVSAGKASSVTWPGAPNFGYTVAGTGATVDSAFSGAKYAGYVSTGEQIASRSSATGGTADTITITNRAAIDYTVPAVAYSDTITYTVTPNYT
jgi:hypothetical protein